jgi:hypothetical protein
MQGDVWLQLVENLFDFSKRQRIGVWANRLERLMFSLILDLEELWD